MRRDLIIMYFAQVLRYVAPLLLVPFYGRTLGIDAYGQLLAAMALMQITWILVEWGLPSTGVRDIAGAVSIKNQQRLIAEQLRARLTLAAFFAPGCTAAALLVPALSANLQVSLLCAALGLANAFNMSWYFQGVMRFKLTAMIEVCGLISSTTVVLLLVRGPSDAWLVPGALLLVSVLSFGVQLALAGVPAWPEVRAAGWSFSCIRQSTLLFVDRGQTLLLGPLSILLLAAVAIQSQVAVFALAERLLGVLLAALGPLNQIFSTQLSKSATTLQQGGCSGATHTLMRKITAYSIGLYALIAGAAFALSDSLLPLVLGSGFDDVAPVFRIQCVTLFALGVASTLTATLLYPLRHDKEVAVISSVRLCTTLIAVLGFGILLDNGGGAWGRFAGACLTLIVVLMSLHRHALLAIVTHRPLQQR